MGPLLQEDILKDAPLHGRQRGRQSVEPWAAVEVAEPIDGEVVDDREEPSGERAVRIDARRAAAQPGEVFLAHGFAHASEDVHHIIIVLGVMTDRREDEAPVAVQEQVPRGFRPASLKLGDPEFHSPAPPKQETG